MQLDLPAQFESYAILGRAFGYPNCCVSWWIAGMDYRVPYSIKPVPEWVSTQFVPCPKCRDRLPSELINVIKERRTVKDPFPLSSANCSPEELVKEFTLVEWADVFESASQAMAAVSQYVDQ